MTTTTKTIIKLFNDEDYHAFARIHNAVFTDFAQSVDEFRFDDSKRPQRCRHARWIAEQDGEAVGYAQFDQHASIFDAHKFAIEIGVDPEHLQRGIGTALYNTVINALRPLRPTRLSTWCRDDMPCYLRFLDNRGFAESTRMWVSELDLATYDARPFEKYTHAVLVDGVEIKTRAELEGDLGLDRALFDLWCEVRYDMPLPPGEVRTEVSFDEWYDYQNHPSRLDEGYFVAFVDGQLAGTSQLWSSPNEPDLLRTGLTGVRRAYRRRGIAFALKLRALDYAKAQPHIRRVITDNASTNRPMLAINEALGFVKKPAWIFFSGQWSEVSGRQ
ncbi:MAG TPA: GNAT family N-acetyltransferase [Chloroflexota bacterium]